MTYLATILAWGCCWFVWVGLWRRWNNYRYHAHSPTKFSIDFRWSQTMARYIDMGMSYPWAMRMTLAEMMYFGNKFWTNHQALYDQLPENALIYFGDPQSISPRYSFKTFDIPTLILLLSSGKVGKIVVGATGPWGFYDIENLIRTITQWVHYEDSMRTPDLDFHYIGYDVEVCHIRNRAFPILEDRNRRMLGKIIKHPPLSTNPLNDLILERAKALTYPDPDHIFFDFDDYSS